MICAAVLLFHAGDYDAIPARLHRARELLRSRSVNGEHRPVEVMVLTLQLAVDRAVGDMPAVAAGGTELLALLAEGGAAEGAPAAQHRAIALNNRGVAQLWTGRTEAAARDLWAAAGASRAAGLELAEINAAGHLALLQVMCGSVHEAAHLAGRARDLADRGGWATTLQAVAAYLALALVHLDRHDLVAAEEALHAGAQAHRNDPEAAQRLVLSGVQARLALAHGDPALARHHLRTAREDRNPRTRVPTLDGWLSLLDDETELAAGHPERVAHRDPGTAGDLPRRVVQARAALALRDLRLAERLLAPEPTALPHTVATVEAGILNALLADAHGQASRAVDFLGGAVSLAEREGIRRPFRHQAGGRLEELLHLCDRTAFTDQLFADIRAARRSPHDTGAGGLSDREADVLRFLPTNLSAGQIAVELGISVNTVKAHLRSIYRKLAASRRGDAVVKARDHGLL
ncbi:LuxR C-terminal-related transcriptional regulator [Actinoplanes sp. NPDC024001]|uniref:LuxR C-terminal-related transcriptional regulator n=1 Tax=Actinoplanes sp. NPDC024001 TaxID=3154598 RepID=UPI0033F7DE4F